MESVNPSWASLLVSAVKEPGIISGAYSQFHHYSIGNQLLAWGQCMGRGIKPGPMATFPRWKELGRHVKRGEKAITLCQPVTIKKKAQDPDGDDAFLLRFTFRNSWFVLAQTEGQEVAPLEIPSWDKGRALQGLDVQEIPFDCPDGNVMGYASQRTVAVNPMNPHAHKTLFHELAHVMLGHTLEAIQADSEITPRNVREVEAESVALICCEALGLDGATFCRGYIQNWIGDGQEISERSAQRIFKAADQILKAGREVEP
jgi:antirestriction protein ArdC